MSNQELSQRSLVYDKAYKFSIRVVNAYKYLTQNKMALGLGNLLNDKYLNELALIFEKFGASEISRFDFNFDSVKSRYIKSFNELCI